MHVEGIAGMPDGSFRILIVDDDTDFCELLLSVLIAEGYEVCLAFDVAQAMDLLPVFRPQLVLTDMMMPDVDGNTFIRTIRSYAPWADLPTLAVSAQPPERARCAARCAGADEFFPKPIELKELRLALRLLLPCSSCKPAA